MPVYTVHEPPLRAADASADPLRVVFVRDGFYLWAFLFAPLWMAQHRLWMVLILYLVFTAAFETALHLLGASGFEIAVVAILISLLIGLEAGTLRRFTLKRRRWQNVGIVSGYDVEDAERRLFADWVREAPARNVTLPSATPIASPAAPIPGVPGSSGVIGLFPEPGARR